MNIEPTNACLGATISGVSLTRVPTDCEVRTLELMLEQYGLLIFPDQNISPIEQIKFSKAFGEIEMDNTVSVSTNGFPELAEVGNLGKRPVSFAPVRPDGELEWHTDHIQHAVPSKSTLLIAKRVPTVGGDTLFSCLFNAYDMLSEDDKRICDNAIGIHSAAGLRNYLADQGEFSVHEVQLSGEKERVHWPLVRKHPLSGRKGLYFAAELTIGIEGWSDKEARAYIKKLTSHTTQPQFVYRHQWKTNQAILWANRRVLHAGTWYDKNRYQRYLLRTMVKEISALLGLTRMNFSQTLNSTFPRSFRKRSRV